MDDKLRNILIAIALPIMQAELEDSCVRGQLTRNHLREYPNSQGGLTLALNWSGDTLVGCCVYPRGKGLGQQIANAKKGNYILRFQ